MSDHRTQHEHLAARVRDLSSERRALLDRLIEEADLVGVDAPILPRPAGMDQAPASFAQRRLWLQKQLDAGNAAYTILAAVRISGPLDVGALERALAGLVERHEALRTSFVAGDAELYQVVAPEVEVRIATEDMIGADDDAVRARTCAELARPFDSSRLPLWRALLLRTGEGVHTFVLTFDHLVADEWTMGVVIEELAALYRAASAGVQADLPALAVQYPDFAIWQRGWLDEDAMLSQIRYWEELLTPLPKPLAFRKDASAAPSERGGRHEFYLEAALAADLRALAKEHNVSLFMLLMAAYQCLIGWYTAQDDFTVGTDVAGRPRAELEPMVGFFVNQLVLRSQLEGKPSFDEILQRTRESVLLALAHQDVPFERLVETLRPRRAGQRSPLFQTKFVLQNTSMPSMELSGLTLTPFEVDPGAYKFELLLNMRDLGDEVRGTFEYSADLFGSHGIARLTRQFVRLLALVVEEPTVSWSALVQRLDAGDGERRKTMKRRLREIKRRVAPPNPDG